MNLPPEIVTLFQWVGAAFGAVLILVLIPLLLGKTLGSWLSDLMDWFR